METAIAFGSSSLGLCIKPSISTDRVLAFDFTRFGSKLSHKQYPSISHVKSGNRRVFYRRYGVLKASMKSPNSGNSPDFSIAPLQMESPVGQFLSQILVSHPHLVPAAVDQQLEQLQIDRDAEKEKKKDESSGADGTDLVLYRRIAELKANERKKALEEILYALVVQKFMDAEVQLIPTINKSSSNSSEKVDTWTPQDDKLKQLHSPEANEMIQNHLTLILGNRLSDPSSVAQISKLRVGQVYAASVMYGYFLRRIDQRFKLEQTMKILPQGLNDSENNSPVEKNNENVKTQTHPEISSFSGPGAGPTATGGFGAGIKPSRLRNYVMSFDGETLQRYATIRSKEAVSIIEKHTEALFGKPEIVITPEGTIDSSKDEQIKISFDGLSRLVLEAVTFGSFLWDIESYVDSRYHFVGA